MTPEKTVQPLLWYVCVCRPVGMSVVGYWPECNAHLWEQLAERVTVLTDD